MCVSSTRTACWGTVPMTVTSRTRKCHLFEFSQKFLQDYLPHTIELGRSFVTLEYQSSRAGAKGLFALDNIWDGLGALTVDYPQIEYFFILKKADELHRLMGDSPYQYVLSRQWEVDFPSGVTNSLSLIHI